MSFLSECTSGGCGAKIGAAGLSELLARLPVKKDPRLLAGFDKHDDAAVWQLEGDKGGGTLVSTVDFFSPMVDDPYTFGKIAAANAISDIYAMGGRPLFALNLVCFPHRYDMTMLEAMLRGGAEKALEADLVIAGGHSIYDHEPKYGLSVTGYAKKFLRNDTCRSGDALILTKPLGVGLITCAARAGKASALSLEAAVASMERLNRYAAEAAANFNVSACTDVTGFGLLVHATEMAGDLHTLVIDSGETRLLPGARECAENGFVTDGGERNREYMAGKTDLSALPPPLAATLLDPQTSGGLLLAVPSGEAPGLLAAIRNHGDTEAAVIGEVRERGKYPVIVR